MSMPEFPNICGLGLTCDRVLELMLEAIAMEQLSLSHVINASAEELQHLSAMSACKNDVCAYTQNIVVINKSVNLILERVNHCQSLLKCELESVLEALERCLCFKQSCPKSDCGCDGLCSIKSQLLLLTDQNYLLPSGCHAMHFKNYCKKGCALSWNCMCPESIILESKKAYQIQIVLSFRLSEPSIGPLKLCLNIQTGEKCRSIPITQCMTTNILKEKIVISVAEIINLKDIHNCSNSKLTVLLSANKVNRLELCSLFLAEL